MAAKPTRARTRKSPQQDITFQPVFTDKQVMESETNYNTTWGVKRRVMMAFLSNSSAALLARIKCAKDAEVLITMAEVILDFRKHLHSGVELADCALERLRALCESVDRINPK